MESHTVFLGKIEDLIREIVTENKIPFYRIESLIETQANTVGTNSFVPVIRLISYFEDSVHLYDILCKEFDLTIVKSVDKSEQEDFSSQQVRYVAALKANRLQLIEYKKWGTSTFEIRICSILQEAWAGMENELKASGAPIYGELKRDLFRVGVLLEMADNQFSKMKNELIKRKGTYTAQPNIAATPEVIWEAPVQAQKPAVETQSAITNIPAPQPNAVAEQIKAVPAETNLESIDMSVDSFNSLAVSVNNIENTQGDTDERFSELLNANANTDRQETETAVADTSRSGGAPSDGVALNIDNIETFNMNVNSMMDKPAEAAREESAAEKNMPFFEEDKNKNVPEVLDENAQMTDATLREYVLNSRLLKEVDQMIAERAGAKVNDEVDIEGDVERLRFLKVFTLKQLHEKISDNKIDIVAFAEKWIGKDNGGSFDSGISLFYLEYLLVGKKNDPAFAVEYVLKFISDNDYSARYIIPTYNSIRQTEQAPSFSHLTLK